MFVFKDHNQWALWLAKSLNRSSASQLFQQGKGPSLAGLLGALCNFAKVRWQPSISQRSIPPVSNNIRLGTFHKSRQSLTPDFCWTLSAWAQARCTFYILLSTLTHTLTLHMNDEWYCVSNLSKYFQCFLRKILRYVPPFWSKSINEESMISF